MSPQEPLSGFHVDALALAHPHGRPFWQAAAAGTLLLPRCRGCGRAHWYPRPFCPFCASDAVVWEPASGLGTISSFTHNVRAAPPTIVAYVVLDEGPTLLTNLVGCTPDEPRIDGRVAVAFRAAPEGRMVPVFTLAAEPPAGSAARAGGSLPPGDR